MKVYLFLHLYKLLNSSYIQIEDWFLSLAGSSTLIEYIELTQK